MQRVSVTLDDELIEEFEGYLQAKGYANRSEAVRDLIRQKLEAERQLKKREGGCMGTLTYVYNHHERELAKRLTQAQHDHHNLSVSTLHVHMDHDNCLETVVLSGRIDEVERFANTIIAHPGVRHGQLYLLPVEIHEDSHAHDPSNTSPHEHLKPLT